jgi:hypothetical protein
MWLFDSVVRCQEPEDRCQRTGVRGQVSEVRDQTTACPAKLEKRSGEGRRMDTLVHCTTQATQSQQPHRKIGTRVSQLLGDRCQRTGVREQTTACPAKLEKRSGEGQENGHSCPLHNPSHAITATTPQDRDKSAPTPGRVNPLTKKAPSEESAF